MKDKTGNGFLLLVPLLYSSKAFACIGVSPLEKVSLIVVFSLSAILAFYSLFSRLIVRPSLFWLPIVISIAAFYFGTVELGCVDIDPVPRSLITLIMCIALSVYETRLRRKAKVLSLKENTEADTKGYS